MQRVVLIPAAGSGSRLGGPLPKLLVPVNGLPMIDHLFSMYAPHADAIIVVVSRAALPMASAALAGRTPPVVVLVQERPTGMLDAVLLARDWLSRQRPRRVLVTWCDQVAVSTSTLAAVIAAAASEPEPALVLPTCRRAHPYVHLRRDAAGTIVDVLHRREGDELPEQGESDAGLFDLSLEAYLDWLPEYAAAPAIGARTGERNFLPFVAWAARRGPVLTVACSDPEEAIGINTPDELVRVEAYLRARRGR